MSKVEGIVMENRHWSGSFPLWFGFEEETHNIGWSSSGMMERQICCLSGAIERQIHIQGWATFCEKLPKNGESTYPSVTFDTIGLSRRVAIRSRTDDCFIVIHPMGKIVIERGRSQLLCEIVEAMRLIKHALMADEYPVIDIKATLLPEAVPVVCVSCTKLPEIDCESSDYEYDSESIDYNDIRSITSEELDAWLNTPLGCC
jgi:hypothetical protein